MPWGYLHYIIDNNYKLLIIFQRVDVYLNEPIKTDVLIKLADLSIQYCTRDRNGEDKNNYYF